jgi:hypothetical protein
VLASLPLTADAEARPRAVMLVALSLFFFLADATLTLLRRAGRGARVWEAHREHLYQDLALRFGHTRVTLAIGTASAVLTAAAVAAFRSGQAGPAWGVVTLALLLFAFEWQAARRVRTA